MIAAWMVYCIAVGLAICVAAWAAGRALYLVRRPTRWAWSSGLLLALLLPLAALVRPKQSGSIEVPIATASAPGNVISVAETPLSRPRLSWADLDGPLGWGWVASSAVMLLALVAAAARLALQRRQWRRVAVEGRDVLVAETVGPAVVGLWLSQVVIPSWALALTDDQKRLMLSHEEEHVRSRDPWLLAGGMAALITAPWNPALWWLVRSLRQAVEMDCDARVVRAGNGPLAYGELLLRVGQSRAHLPIAALALGEPRSLLELRIRRLSARLPRHPWLGTTAALGAATAAIIASCEAPHPVSSAVSDEAAAAQLAPDSVFDINSVEVKPERLASPMPVYPPLLQRAHIQGVVMVQAVIDTLGHPEPNSLKIISTPNPGFNESAKQMLLHSVFGPARLHGKAVRVRLQIPIQYTIGRQIVHADSASHGEFGEFGPDASYLELLARQYHPEVFTHPAPQAAVALVLDAGHRIVAHAVCARHATTSARMS